MGPILSSEVEDSLDFGRRDHRQESAKEEEAGEEQAETSEEGSYLDVSRGVISPTRGKKVAVERYRYNNEALHPHSDVNQYRNRKNPSDVASDRFEP